MINVKNTSKKGILILLLFSILFFVTVFVIGYFFPLLSLNKGHQNYLIKDFALDSMNQLSKDFDNSNHSAMIDNDRGRYDEYVKDIDMCIREMGGKSCNFVDKYRFWNMYNLSGQFYVALEKTIYPFLVHGWTIIKASNDLAVEKKIDLRNSLIYEYIDVKGPHKDEIMNRLMASIRYSAQKSQKAMLKFFAFSFPAIVKLAGDKIKIGGVLKDMRKLADKLSKRESEINNSPYGIFVEKERFIYYKDKIAGKIKSQSLAKLPSNPDSKIQINNTLHKLLDKKKNEKLINLSNLGNGPLNYKIFLYGKKIDPQLMLKVNDEFLNQIISKNLHPKPRIREFVIKKRYSGLKSIIKSAQINSGRTLDIEGINHLVQSFNKTKIYIPKIRTNTAKLLKFDVDDYQQLDEVNQKLVINLASILKIMIHKGNFIDHVSLLPADFVHHYKVMNLKQFSYEKADVAFSKIKEILTGKTKPNIPLIVTALIYKSNDEKNNSMDIPNLNYINLIHYDHSKSRFLVDESGDHYWIKEKKLQKLMKFNVKNSIVKYIKDSDKQVIKNLFGYENDEELDKGFSIVAQIIKNRIGGIYSFVVADPRGILGL